MGWLKQRRADKLLGEFAVQTAMHGGSFSTTCTPQQVLDWFADVRSGALVDRTATSATVHPTLTSGAISSELVTVRVAEPAGTAIRVDITVEVATAESRPALADGLESAAEKIVQFPNGMTLNLNALGPIMSLTRKVSDQDPAWRPLTK